MTKAILINADLLLKNKMVPYADVTNDDLTLGINEPPEVRIVKNGKRIFEKLKNLSEHSGYKIIIYSNTLSHQDFHQTFDLMAYEARHQKLPSVELTFFCPTNATTHFPHDIISALASTLDVADPETMLLDEDTASIDRARSGLYGRIKPQSIDAQGLDGALTKVVNSTIHLRYDSFVYFCNNFFGNYKGHWEETLLINTYPRGANGGLYFYLFAGTKASVFDKLEYIFKKLSVSYTKEEKNPITQEEVRLLLPPSELVKLNPSFVTHAPVYSELDDIKILCARYLGHAWEVHNGFFTEASPKDLNEKEGVFAKIYHAKDIEEVQTLLHNNKKLLGTHRSSYLTLTLEAIGVLLTLPISVPILLYKKQSIFYFFEPESALLKNKIEAICTAKPTPGRS